MKFDYKVPERCKKENACNLSIIKKPKKVEITSYIKSRKMERIVDSENKELDSFVLILNFFDMVVP